MYFSVNTSYKKENGNLRGTSGKRFDCAGDG